MRVPLTARIDDVVASIVNLSHGGLCMRVDSLPHAVAASFEFTVPTANVTLHADAVWTTAGINTLWTCGAEIAPATDSWRHLVDTVS